MVSVNGSQCQQLGVLLKGLSIRPEFLQRAFLNIPEDRETRLRVYLFSAAICHQTHHLYHPAKNLWGWEYMEYGFLEMVRLNKAMLNPGIIEVCSVEEVKEQLIIVFSPKGSIATSTLDRIDERVGMLKEICKDIRSNYKGKVTELIDSCKGLLINQGLGLYEVLGRYKGFSDPQKKKITFFIKLATDAGVLFIKDPKNLLPIMDYHMQRVLLRMGCVEVDDDLKSRLVNREVLASDHEIRTACMQALQIVAQVAGKGILQMNDYFWPLGRSCCNETTLCADHTCLKSPCTFYKMIEQSNHDSCIFESVCKGVSDKSYRQIWEPVVETHFY